MELDIRKKPEEVDVIRICETSALTAKAAVLIKENLFGASFNSHTWEESTSDDRLSIRNKEHALNVIKAIEKAIELGWFDVVSAEIEQ